jgi:hypothetical protein
MYIYCKQIFLYAENNPISSLHRPDRDGGIQITGQGQGQCTELICEFNDIVCVCVYGYRSASIRHSWFDRVFFFFCNLKTSTQLILGSKGQGHDMSYYEKLVDSVYCHIFCSIHLILFSKKKKKKSLLIIGFKGQGRFGTL